MINILATYREMDIVGYDMLGRLSQEPDFNIYVAASSEEVCSQIQGDCKALNIMPLTSKFNGEG